VRINVVSIALAAAVFGAATPAAAIDPVPSFRRLVTGNGFGFQVFDANDNAIIQYLERPYRFMRPNPSNPDGEGIVRRNLAFDTYFGIRTPTASVWLGKQTPDDVGYVDESNVIRSATTIGDIKTESMFWAPYGYEGNAMVMVLRAPNEGTGSAAVEAFSIHNFKLGSAPNPDEPGANSESIQFSGGAATETGPGGGDVVYLPIAGADVSSCADNVFTAVEGGQDLTSTTSCSGTDKVNAFQRSLGTLAAGESAMWGVVILFDEDGAAARSAWDAFAAGRDAETLLADALAEWEDWRVPPPGGLSAVERRVWRQSEAVLRMGQVLEHWSESPKRKGHGMILASLPPGGWHSGWVRDAVYAIVALARTGHHAEAKDALNFFLNAEANKYGSFLNDVTYRITTVRYFGNGEEEAGTARRSTTSSATKSPRPSPPTSSPTAWPSPTRRSGRCTGATANTSCSPRRPRRAACATWPPCRGATTTSTTATATRRCPSAPSTPSATTSSTRTTSSLARSSNWPAAPGIATAPSPRRSPGA
jgi:hypothetical protein